VAFVDTSFLYAAIDRHDGNHTATRNILQDLSGEALVTTSQVLGEAWTLTRSRLGHRQAVGLVDGIRRGTIYEVIHIDPSIENAAFDWLHRRDERAYSFVDATSFQVMWDRRIDTALAFDADFEAAGFVTLRP